MQVLKAGHMQLLGMSYITFACPCSDWPVFGDLDNMGPRDHDRMDNHRVSGEEGDCWLLSVQNHHLDQMVF